MKPVKLFYLTNCPFCRKALRYIDGVKVHEGGIYPDEVEAILRKAMK